MTNGEATNRAGTTAAGAKRVAAIDCGTNSLRLLIADIDLASRQLADVQRRMEIVRLGQGVDATGMLAPDALARTMRVLAEYASEIRSAGATSVRMVATSATRDASNAADFTRGVEQTLGITPEVVSGSEEAMLSFAGATAELAGPDAGGGLGPGPQPEPPYLVVDIGGGSTEFVLGGGVPDDDLASVAGGLAGISVDIGCVRLTERHLRSDPPTDAEVKGATADIDAALDKVAAVIAVPDARTLVGLAGSVTTVAAIALGLQKYDPGRTHHARISADAVHAVTKQLLGQTRRERAAIGSMHPGRVDVIAAGALLLDRVMQRFGFDEVLVSEHDILDGIAWSIAGA
jgi:exopolyphosphatase / guanosine-5'-triphosphate,3'-diphosphate pyrophosphatase